MEDLQGWLGERGDRQLPLPSQQQQQPQPQPNPQPVAVAAESWRRAESATRDIIGRIQSTVVSEERRRAVVEYVQKLIRGCVGSEVFPYGSVPLKTYLPDGDIDLTALGVPNAEDALARNVRSVLDGEEQKRDGEFEVKDVQYIHAEVKLVKCLVQNIVVDISFNQIGGLCTLCFLERVDRLIGKENLFKRSIILIKAWCYYESRILGAHHGLISTYALETLVLYIFHLFHSSLDGPLAVLYRFLDYYSKFDWDNYCISLHGPVPVSSLPELIAQPPENEGGDLLLSSEFLKSCVEMFSVPSRGSESSSRVFLQKHLNIVDPLKENNNLGRSVSKGNFYRIRSAFSYGARKLGRILLLPSENIGEEINVFFMNTLDRHGSGERPDVQDSFPRCLNDTEVDHMGESTVKKGKDDKLISESPTVDGALCDEVNKIKISGSDKELDMEVHSGNHLSNDRSAANFFHSIEMETNGPGEAGVVSDGRLAGDAQDLATSRATISRNANETSEASSSSSETGGSPSGKAYHAPHSSYQFENVRGIGKLDHKSPRQAGVSSERDLVRPQSYETDSSSSDLSWLASNHVLPSSCMPNGRSLASSWSTSSSQSSHVVDSPSPKAKDNGTNGSAKSLNLVDLTGDYDTHYKNLEYARWCQEYMLGGVFLPNHQSSPSQNRNKHSWDIFHGQNMFVHMNANGVVPGPPFSPPGIYSMLHPIMSGAYATEDMPKPRGTGTYFPNMNYRTYRERQSSGRGRASVPTNQMTRARNNGRPTMPADNLAEKVSHETHTQPQPRGYSGNGRGKPASLDLTLPLRSTMKGFPHANGFVNLHEGRLEFGSLGSVSYGSSSPEVSRKSDFASPRRQGSGQGIPFSTAHGQGSSLNSERPMQAYHLKDDDDFPPLTG